MPRRDTLTRRHGKTGRKPALTPQVADTLVNTVADGNHITTACGLAGVTTSSLYRWIKRAEAVDAAIEAGQPYDPDEDRYREFRDRLLDARARAAVRAVDVISRAMQGGYVIEEEPALDGDGKVIHDENGAVVMRRRFAQPDGRLALSYLGRAQPAEWGRNETARLELSGPGGLPLGAPAGEDGEGPVDADAVARLASRLAEHIANREEPPALTTGEQEEYDGEGEVFEAEVVDEGD